MASELVGALLNELQRETQIGYEPGLQLVGSGTVRGLSFPKNKAQAVYDLIIKIPGNATLTTGIKIDLLVTDDGADANDLGLVARFGAAAKKIVSGTDTADLTTGAGTEQTVDVTLNATTAVCVTGTISIANANLDSAAAGDWLGIRLRRVADHANDTCRGRVVVVAAAAYAY